MLNVWYDFSTASRWKPYIGGVVGFMRVNQGDLEYDPQGPPRKRLRTWLHSTLRA